MKILQITALFPPYVIGGAELTAARLARGLRALGDEVHTVSLAPPAATSPPEQPHDDTAPVERLQLANLYWPYARNHARPNVLRRLIWHVVDTHNARMARAVAGVVRRVQPDVVLAHNLQGFSTATLPAVAACGVPVVQVLHDFSLLCPRTILFRDGRNCGHGSARCIGCRLLTAPRWRDLRVLSGVVGVSEAVLRLHQDHGLFAKTPAEVIPNALPPELSPVDAPPAYDPERVFSFGFLGRVDTPKGIEVLLEAATRLAATGVRFRLLIGGGGNAEYVASLRSRWPLAEVEYRGYVKAAEFLSSVDVLVFPVISLEAMGNVVFEAYSRAVPVIASACGGVVENVEHGVTGFLVPPGNVEVLVARMRELLSDRKLRSRMAIAALKISRQYSPERRTLAYRRFLGEIVARTPRRATGTDIANLTHGSDLQPLQDV